MKIESWSGSDVGRVRGSNEDSVGHFPEIGLFIVADGMGGHAAGEVASRMAVDIIRECLAASANAANDPGSQLGAAVVTANQRIFEAGHRAQAEKGASMGSTVVLLKVDEQTGLANWAHVGDSRLYRLRQGALALLTADHTLQGTQYLDTPVIPADLPHSSRLLQALGTQEEVRVSMNAEALAAGDVFLLCSDGISGLLDAAAITDALTANPGLADAGQTLIRRALEAGGTDNASAVLVRALGD